MIRMVPNLLTLGRLVLTIALLIMLLYSPGAENRVMLIDIAFVIFVIAGITDIVDGKLARMYNVTSKFGRIVDPLADKILVCGSFIVFTIIGEPKLFTLSGSTLFVIHILVAAIVILREAYVTILRQVAEARGISFAATASGKAKMFLQSFSIGTIMVKMAHVQDAAWGNWFTSAVLFLMLFATVYSGFRSTMRKSTKQAFSKNPTEPVTE